jgi:hypothetical protein
MLVIEFGSLDAKMFKYFTHKHEAEAPSWLDFRHFAYVLFQTCRIRALLYALSALFLIEGAAQPSMFDQNRIN